MTDTEIRPFSNNSQWEDWYNANCCKCRKSIELIDPGGLSWPPQCKIEEANVTASCITGTVSEAIAQRMGYLEHSGCYNWQCNEREPT
ncbi:hypothetical protein LCGC14_0387030 [marine sediment metagenome]|uniref:Uncharacterized protein n=1 Tax=marine sediment metagenome TaxID=412755 RepID=A0A0F9T0R5_9ZZZZ